MSRLSDLSTNPMLRQFAQVLRPSVSKRVHHHDPLGAARGQRVRQVRADEPASTGYHDRSVS